MPRGKQNGFTRIMASSPPPKKKGCQISLVADGFYETCGFIRTCECVHRWSVLSPTDREPWVFYRGAEYLLVQQPFDWDSVSLACQMMGAYLLSVHSKEELHFVKEHLRRVCFHLQNMRISSIYFIFNHRGGDMCGNV